MAELSYISYDITENIVHNQLGIKKVFTSNKKYKYHKYAIPNCGDKEQMYLMLTQGQSDHDCEDNLDRIFDYIYDNFKRGIYVSVRNGKLSKFIPFVNEGYMNNFVSGIDTNSKKNLLNIKGLKIMDEHYWYADNQVIYIYQNSLDNMNSWSEQDKQYHSMFQGLIDNRVIKDCDFFINTWVSPIVSVDANDPWIYGRQFNDNLLDIKIPILSIASSDRFRDILIPSYRDYFDNPYSIDFFERDNRIVYRGTTITTVNPDPKTAYYTMCLKHDDKFNYNPTSTYDGCMIDDGKLVIKDHDRISIHQEGIEYKYMMMIHSHSGCFEFSRVLSSGSIPFYVKGSVTSYLENHMKEWVHYIPVKPDMSDLLSNYEWIESNPEEQSTMLLNLSKLTKLIEIDSIYDNLSDTLNTLDKLTTKVTPINGIRYDNKINHPVHHDIVYYDEQWKQDHCIYVSSLINDIAIVNFKPCVSIVERKKEFVSFIEYIEDESVTNIFMIVRDIADYLDKLYSKGIGFTKLYMEDIMISVDDYSIHINNYENSYVKHGDKIIGSTLYTKYETSGILSLITQLLGLLIIQGQIEKDGIQLINMIFKELYEPYYSNKQDNIVKGLTQKRKFLLELIRNTNIHSFLDYQHSKKRLQTNKGYSDKLKTLIRTR